MANCRDFTFTALIHPYLKSLQKGKLSHHLGNVKTEIEKYRIPFQFYFSS